MKIQVCSDLHLEFPSNLAWLSENPLIPQTDLLIIAGDTYHLDKDYAKLDFIRRVSDEFNMTYLIPGNHEYYGGFDAVTAVDQTYYQIRENVILLNNAVLDLEGIRFIFSTMWSEIHSHIPEILWGMADFQCMSFKGERFDIGHFNEVHERSFSFLQEEISKPGKKVVVTHHLPSETCNVEEFKDSPLNAAFCVDKTDIIAQSDVSAWIYGHSHRNKADFEINGTSMITNQLGYVGWGEHLTFQRNKVIEIT